MRPRRPWVRRPTATGPNSPGPSQRTSRSWRDSSRTPGQPKERASTARRFTRPSSTSSIVPQQMDAGVSQIKITRLTQSRTAEQLTTALLVQIPMHVRGAWPAMLYSVYLSWWKRQVSHHRWIWGIRCVQARKHASEGIHPGFETQGRCHQKSKTGVSVALQKRTCVLQIFKKKKKDFHHFQLGYDFTENIMLLITPFELVCSSKDI